MNMLNTEQVKFDEISHEMKHELVRKQHYFAQFSDDEVDVLITLFKTRYAMAGETIVTQGDFVNSIYLIVSGTVDVVNQYVDNGAIKSERITTLSAGAAIGLNEEGLYSLSGKRTATVIAFTDAVLLDLSVAAFHGFALASTHVAQVLREHTNRNMDDN